MPIRRFPLYDQEAADYVGQNKMEHLSIPVTGGEKPQSAAKKYGEAARKQAVQSLVKAGFCRSTRLYLLTEGKHTI